jgi:hypothetical protein
VSARREISAFENCWRLTGNLFHNQIWEELPTIRPEPSFSLPTAPFLNPDISDAKARLAGARLHHTGVGSQIRTFARMDAMVYDKTAKSERLLG